MKGWVAIARLLFLPIAAEISECLDFVVQFLDDEFDHDGVVEVTQHRHVVRDDVLGFREIGKRREHVLPFGARQRPLLILDHLDEALEFADPLMDESRNIGASDLLDDCARLGDDLGLVGLVGGRPGPLDDRAEVVQVLGIEVESNSH